MLNRALARVGNRISRPFVGHTQMPPFGSMRNASTFLRPLNSNRASYILIVGGGFTVGCLSLYRWFHFEKSHGEAKPAKLEDLYFWIGTSLFVGCGGIAGYHLFPYILSGYSPWAVHRTLKYCRPRREFGHLGDVFASRQRKLSELTKLVNYSFTKHQNFIVFFGPKGIGKTELAKNMILLMNKLDVGTVFAECSEQSIDVLNGILEGFDPDLPRMVKVTMSEVETFKALEKLLRAHLPSNGKFLIVVDGVTTDDKYVRELQRFARDMSEHQGNCANVKVMLVCSDAVDILKALKIRKETRALQFFMGAPSNEVLKDFVQEFCKTNEVNLPQMKEGEDAVDKIVESLEKFGWDIISMQNDVLDPSIISTNDDEGKKIKRIDYIKVKKNAEKLDYVAKAFRDAGVVEKEIVLNFIKDHDKGTPFSYEALERCFVDNGLSKEGVMESVVQTNLAYVSGDKLVFHPQVITYESLTRQAAQGTDA